MVWRRVASFDYRDTVVFILFYFIVFSFIPSIVVKNFITGDNTTIVGTVACLLLLLLLIFSGSYTIQCLVKFYVFSDNIVNNKLFRVCVCIISSL
jgi:hypothetical protein